MIPEEAANHSFGRELLTEWFGSRYCIEERIGRDSVSGPVREYLGRTL